MGNISRNKNGKSLRLRRSISKIKFCGEALLTTSPFVILPMFSLRWREHERQRKRNRTLWLCSLSPKLPNQNSLSLALASVPFTQAIRRVRNGLGGVVWFGRRPHFFDRRCARECAGVRSKKCLLPGLAANDRQVSYLRPSFLPLLSNPPHTSFHAYALQLTHPSFHPCHRPSQELSSFLLRHLYQSTYTS